MKYLAAIYYANVKEPEKRWVEAESALEATCDVMGEYVVGVDILEEME